MDQSKNLKLLGYGLVALLVANLVLFALGLVSALVFWLIIAVVALVAWKVVPKMKKDI